MKPRICKNFTDPTAPPGCLMAPDERYTMDFSAIGEDPIYWCSHCGPMAQQIDALLAEAFETRPGFYEEFKKSLEERTRTDMNS